MVTPELQFTLRARHLGTDPIHAARTIKAGGYNTACQMWLDAKAPHQWLPETSMITCGKCASRVITTER